jgi:chromosome segregation ATPase
MRVAAALIVMFVSSSVQADDLAALARKEKERRAKLAKPTKVLTEEDSKEAATKGSGSLTALTGPAPATTGMTNPEAQRAAWKQRADAARAAVASAESRLAQLETERTKFNADLAPVSAAEAQDPLRLQKRSAKLAEMHKEVDAQKLAVEAARKALVALDEQARKEGVPPGWLR